MSRKQRPAVLRRAIDPSGDIDAQTHERFKAIFAHHGVGWDGKDAERRVMVALMLELYPIAFEIRARPTDARRKVDNLDSVIAVIDAVKEGTEDQLQDAELRKLAKNVGKRLRYANLRVTVENIYKAIPKEATGELRRASPITIRDNYYRPPGTRKRDRSKRELLAALKSFRDALLLAAQTAPEVEPWES
jgi:hypothetical protein